MKQVRLDLSASEYERLHFATSVISNLAGNPEFKNLVRKNYNLTDEQIQTTIMGPISTVTQQVHIPKAIDVSSPPKATFFTSRMNSTDKSRYLFNEIVKTSDTSTLLFDQNMYTCISDVRSMIYKYNKIDGLIQSLCPVTGPTEITSKTFMDMAKEITEWAPKK